MNDKEKKIFERGRNYERVLAEQRAEEKYESIIISLLERVMGGAGTISIPNSDLMMAKSRFVTFMQKDYQNDALEIKMVEEVI